MFTEEAHLCLFTVILLLRNPAVNISVPQRPWLTCLLAFSLSSWLLENSGFGGTRTSLSTSLLSHSHHCWGPQLHLQMPAGRLHPATLSTCPHPLPSRVHDGKAGPALDRSASPLQPSVPTHLSLRAALSCPIPPAPEPHVACIAVSGRAPAPWLCCAEHFSALGMESVPHGRDASLMPLLFGIITE